MSSITSIKCVLTQEHLDAVCSKYFVPEEIHPQSPGPDDTMHERPTGKVRMYTRFFDYANYRIPFSNFFVSVLTHFRIPFSQLCVFGSAKVSQFEILCRICNIEPSVELERPLFWVDEFVVPASARFAWFSGTNIVNDRAPAVSEYNVEHANTLIAQASPFLRFPEEFLCWVGVSHNYLFNKDTYPRFEYENGEEMDLNAFFQTADPRKVRIVKRARTEKKRPIVTVAKHRTVTLLPTSVPRPSRELSDSVEREFGEDVSGSGGEGQENASVGSHGNVEPIVPVADDVVAETGSSKVKSLKKKRVIRESEDTPAASHPPKKLRANYRKTSGSVTKASPLEEGGDHIDSAASPALRTIGPFERFVVLSDSSHHSSVKYADAEVDSLIRFVAPVMTVATTVTTSVSTAATTTITPADVGKDNNVPTPSIFAGSSSSEKTDHTLSLFTGRSGSDFVVGDIRAEGSADTGLQDIYVPEWSVTRGFELNDGRSCADMIDHFTPPTFFKAVRGMEHEQLFAKFNVFAARNLSLSFKVRMRAEYNILEKRKWKSLAEERNNLLQVKDKEIKSLEAIESLLQGEVASAKEHNNLLEQERNALNLKATTSSLPLPRRTVHELEVSSAGLREKLEKYEGSVKQLEEFQDKLMEPLKARLSEIDADFIKFCMHFQETFHPHLLNTIARRRWFLTYGMRLLMAKCLNSTEYIEALGNAFGRAIKKGMQEGLAAGIEHGC
ncbi:hypothetical protein Tco_0665350 [Tanacetum coccineum]